MKGITVKYKGDFSKTRKFFNRMLSREYLNVLDQYGREGVTALSSATPKDSGLASSSWYYEIHRNNEQTAIVWYNSDEESSPRARHSVNIAIILQYGYVNGHGAYIQGRDYINPSIQPVFDRIVDALWEEVEKE